MEKFYYKKNKGFSFMEFIFVIAIIGVLSSIMFISLNHARVKANDVRSKAQVASLRSSAQLYYNENGNYGATSSNSCDSSFFADVPSGMREFTDQGNYGPGSELTCRSTVTAYAVSVLLPEIGGGSSWCVDSNGISKLINAPIEEASCQ